MTTRMTSRAVVLAIGLLILGGCGVGRQTASAAPSTAIASGTASAATGTAPEPTVSAPAYPSPVGPPDALLDGLAAATRVRGVLGSFTWDQSGSDAPWLTGPPAGAARPGASLRVTFADGGMPVRWQARWATITGSAVGTPEDGGSGTAADIGLQVPEAGGTWSLALTVSFGTGRSATWTWRIEVGS